MEMLMERRQKCCNVTLEQMVPLEQTTRRLEKILDYEQICREAAPYYQGSTEMGLEPVRLIQFLLLANADIADGVDDDLVYVHSLISDSLSMRWFLGLELSEPIPTFKKLCIEPADRLPDEFLVEILARILNKIANHHVMDKNGMEIVPAYPKKKWQKEETRELAKYWVEDLRTQIDELRNSCI